jgi:hypothetical protein
MEYSAPLSRERALLVSPRRRNEDWGLIVLLQKKGLSFISNRQRRNEGTFFVRRGWRGSNPRLPPRRSRVCAPFAN